MSASKHVGYSTHGAAVACCDMLCQFASCCAVLCCHLGAPPRVQQQLPGGSGAPQAQYCGWTLCVQAVWAAATAAAGLQQVTPAVQVWVDRLNTSWIACC